MLKNTFFSKIPKVNVQEYLAYLLEKQVSADATEGSENNSQLKKNCILFEELQKHDFSKKHPYLNRNIQGKSIEEVALLVSMRRYALQVAVGAKRITDEEFNAASADMVKTWKNTGVVTEGNLLLKFHYGL